MGGWWRAPIVNSFVYGRLVESSDSEFFCIWEAGGQHIVDSFVYGKDNSRPRNRKSEFHEFLPSQPLSFFGNGKVICRLRNRKSNSMILAEFL